MRMSSLSLPRSKHPWQGKRDKEQRGERSEAGEAGGCFISKRGTTAAPLLLPLGTSVTGELGSYRPQGTKQRQVRVYSFPVQRDRLSLLECGFSRLLSGPGART